MADVTIKVKSGETIRQGDAVCLVSSTLGFYTTLHPQVNENPSVCPSGSFGHTDDSYLDTRFVRPSGGYLG